ncbi:MAG: GyrI-like domain-containing protein [Chloroflexia bacterium]|nr:GyrI-like domain-containing protein [Chloroflexia bacterium]
MMTEPTLTDREEQPYMGHRTRATMQELGTAIPQGLDAVFAWLEKQGVTPAGAPFVRYHVIDMEAELDIELGVPVAAAMPGDGDVAAGVLPAGRYAALVYTGIENGIPANAALLDWGAANGLAWDTWATEKGDAFGARFESFLSDPDEEPDPARWQTEVAIRLAENDAR